MSSGEWKTATIAAGATKSDAVDLGRGYQYMNVQIPDIDSCTLNLSVAEKIGYTYRELDPSVLIPETGGLYNDTWEVDGWQFIKIVCSKPQTAIRTFCVRGSLWMT